MLSIQFLSILCNLISFSLSDTNNTLFSWFSYRLQLTLIHTIDASCCQLHWSVWLNVMIEFGFYFLSAGSSRKKAQSTIPEEEVSSTWIVCKLLIEKFLTSDLLQNIEHWFAVWFVDLDERYFLLLDYVFAGNIGNSWMRLDSDLFNLTAVTIVNACSLKIQAHDGWL